MRLKLLIWIIGLFMLIPFAFSQALPPFETHWWTFEDSFVDNGTADVTLVATGNPSFIAGHVADTSTRAINFSFPSGQRLSTNSFSTVNPRNLSFAFWVNITDVNNILNELISLRAAAADVITIGIGNIAGEIQARAGDGKFIVNGSIAGFSGIFTHIAVTANEADETIKLYINGVLQQTATGLNTIVASDGNFHIAATGTPEARFDGSIDDFRIWFNYVLSDDNVSSLFCLGAGTNDSLTEISGCLPVPIVQSGKPVFNSSSINNSNPKINDVIALSQEFADNVTLTEFRFFHNQTGSFVNQTPITISGFNVNGTFNLSITLTRGNVIGFGWHITDNASFTNTSDIGTITIANTPPETPIILFPTANLITNVQPLDINVTFNQDADGDAITIQYYINGILNQTSSSNISFVASDGVFNINVSLSDSAGFFSANASVNNITIDTTFPIIISTSPLNDSSHSSAIPVAISCTDTNIFILNYTFFNSSFDILKTVQNGTPFGTELTITDSISIVGLPDGSYQINVSCSDTHTKKNIGDYMPVKDLGNLKLTYTTPKNNDNVGIKLKSTTATLDDFGTIRESDRYVFWFSFLEPEDGTIYEYVFKINNQKELSYLADSTFNAHFVTRYNWIDFEFDNNDDAIYTIKQTNDGKFEVKIQTKKTFLNFRSIGGLNVATQEIILTIDTTIPPAEAVLPLEGIANLAALFILFLIVGGAFFAFFRSKEK